MRLELVGVAVEQLEVADAEMADTGREDVAERQRGEGRVAAGAAALDRQALGVDVPAVDEVARRPDAIVDVDEAPLAVEALRYSRP